MEMHHEYLLWTTIAITFFIAGITKGVVGLGLPTVSVALLSLVMMPREAAAILIIPSLVTNLWQMVAGCGLPRLLRRFWTMLAGIAAGTLAAGGVLSTDAGGYARAFLGVLLVLYGLSGLAAFRVTVAGWLEPWASPLIGAATGAISAVTGVFVIPAVPFLQGLNLDKDELIQALGLAFTASTIALAAMLGTERAIGSAQIGMSVFALIPALGGMAFGQRVRQRMAVATFRKCLFAGLMAIGLHLVLSAA